jgi:hypothetical protein
MTSNNAKIKRLWNSPDQDECAECERLKSAEAKARQNGDPSKEVDYRALARRHLRTVHGVVSVVRA